MKTLLTISFLVLTLINSTTLCFPSTADNNKLFDVHVSIHGKEEYKGIVIGTLFLIKMNINNLTGNDYNLGDSFRVLMSMKDDVWNQFSMAASGDKNFKIQNRHLRYGSGASSLSILIEKDNELELEFENSAIIRDSSDRQTIDVHKWWPKYLPSKGSVTITWPTFWFSNTSDKPKYISTPLLTTDKEKYYYWVNCNTNESREILFNSENLLKIIDDNSEMPALRCAAVRWLLDFDRNNEKQLLRYLQDNTIPDSLAYRSMQALMIWGSPEIIDEIFSLWKNRKLSSVLDKDMKYYFTWSSHENAEKYTNEVKNGNR